jgi:hypothetical protein
MPTFEVAHFHEQGQDMIVIPVNHSFGSKPQADMNAVKASLQVCASAAGLRGTVVLVWDAGGGRMGFLAPSHWQPFFRGLSLAQVRQNVNRRLTCG